MKRLWLCGALIVALTGCAQLRGLSGKLSDIGGNSENKSASVPEKATPSDHVSANNIPAVEKYLPHGLPGDTVNQVHGGDVIAPQ